MYDKENNITLVKLTVLDNTLLISVYFLSALSRKFIENKVLCVYCSLQTKKIYIFGIDKYFG